MLPSISWKTSVYFFLLRQKNVQLKDAIIYYYSMKKYNSFHEKLSGVLSALKIWEITQTSFRKHIKSAEEELMLIDIYIF
ncbi:hypothetical protein BDB01DRAFT_13955 [Pilobolus umbonatus]|nr:hypothetical protein BDB01DRAFT_13955 [Pilobolus umbonatus]